MNTSYYNHVMQLNLMRTVRFQCESGVIYRGTKFDQDIHSIHIPVMLVQIKRYRRLVQP